MKDARIASKDEIFVFASRETRDLEPVRLTREPSREAFESKATRELPPVRPPATKPVANVARRAAPPPRMAHGSVEVRTPFVTVAEAAESLSISATVLGDVVASGGFKVLRSPHGAILLLRTQVEELRVELRESKRREKWGADR